MLLDELPQGLRERLPDVRAAIHYLHHRQFFAVSSERTQSIRRTLDNPALREFVIRHFEFAGYSFHYNDGEGWYGVVPMLEEVLPPRMTAKQTLVLFVLAVEWHRCNDNDSVDARMNAHSGVEVVWEAIEARLSASKAIALTKKEFLDILKTELSTKNVVLVGDYDPDADDFPLTIRPFIRLLAGEEPLSRLVRFLDRERPPLAAVPATDPAPDGASDSAAESENEPTEPADAEETEDA